jgi:RNA polymerase primary sigma factor
MTQGENETGFQIYLRQISKFPRLTAEQEVELARRIKLGDQQARAEMVRSNLKLVVRIARDYANFGLPLLDLISEGNIGLMKAVERFDPEKGGKLSTYAAWWIKESIRRALANQGKTIRLPVHLVDKIGKIRRVSLRIAEELGREPTDEELAEEIGLSVLKIKELRNAAVRPASLDQPIQGDESLPFREVLGDDESENPFEQLRDKDMLEEVGELLDLLTDREREIINSRFGLEGQRPETLGEVGEKFGVTRERVRQLQKVALDKLRRALARKERSRADASQHEARLASQQGPRFDGVLTARATRPPENFLPHLPLKKHPWQDELPTVCCPSEHGHHRSMCTNNPGAQPRSNGGIQPGPENRIEGSEGARSFQKSERRTRETDHRNRPLP